MRGLQDHEFRPALRIALRQRPDNVIRVQAV